MTPCKLIPGHMYKNPRITYILTDSYPYYNTGNTLHTGSEPWILLDCVWTHPMDISSAVVKILYKDQVYTLSVDIDDIYERRMRDIYEI